MGDAADDAFDVVEEATLTIELMKAAGYRPCPRRHTPHEDECPVCRDFGWIDANGNPGEA